MNIKTITDLLGKYNDRGAGTDPYTTIVLFRDGSGYLMNDDNERVPGTVFDNVDELCDVLTGKKEVLKELQKAQEAYVEVLGKCYLPGSRIILQVVNQDNVEVTVRPA